MMFERVGPKRAPERVWVMVELPSAVPTVYRSLNRLILDADELASYVGSVESQLVLAQWDPDVPVTLRNGDGEKFLYISKREVR